MKNVLIAMLPVVLLLGLWLFIWATLERRKHPPSEETLETMALLNARGWLPSGGAAMIFELVYMGAYQARRLTSLPGALKSLLLVPVVLSFAWFIYLFIRDSRQGDEFERAIQHDALSLAFLMFLTWAMGMWLMDEVWPTPHHGTFSVALGWLPLYYFVGLLFAKARYLPTHKDRP
jgi:hypothetical protein